MKTISSNMLFLMLAAPLKIKRSSTVIALDKADLIVTDPPIWVDTNDNIRSVKLTKKGRLCLLSQCNKFMRILEPPPSKV